MGSTTTVIEKPSNLFRVLSTAIIINSQAFAKASPTEQTATMTQAVGKTVLFVENFYTLTNPALIRDKLLKGEDVSTELEFNGLELTSEELSMLSRVRPILDKIANIGPSYPWTVEADEATKNDYQFGSQSIKRKSQGYTIGYKVAEKLWNRASRYWSGSQKPQTHYENAGGYHSKPVVYNLDSIQIGCQTIPRSAVEYIARVRGWVPNVYES
jgi:hypothetical protein